MFATNREVLVANTASFITNTLRLLANVQAKLMSGRMLAANAFLFIANALRLLVSA